MSHLQDATDLSGENIVSIAVLECSPKLVAEAVGIAGNGPGSVDESVPFSVW